MLPAHVPIMAWWYSGLLKGRPHSQRQGESISAHSDWSSLRNSGAPLAPAPVGVAFPPLTHRCHRCQFSLSTQYTLLVGLVGLECLLGLVARKGEQVWKTGIAFVQSTNLDRAARTANVLIHSSKYPVRLAARPGYLCEREHRG